MKVEMGKVYWRLDNTTDTFDTLKSTLESLGIISDKQESLGTEFGFDRVMRWSTPYGLSFSTIWYKNLCTIRLGYWDADFAEISFDSIQGSYGPCCDHNTIDFMYRGNPMFRLALKEE